jgi:GTP cyclohydrolase I
MLPFYGHASICYHPNERVVGLSKLTRLVDCFAKRLQIQERLVEQVANTLYEAIEPKGVFVHMEAIHFCCKGRGIRRNVNFITEAECGTVTDGMRSLGREVERTNE